MSESSATCTSAKILGHSCVSCRKAKRRCDKQTPCSRCVRLNRRCVQQTKIRGKPKRRGWRGPPRVPKAEAVWPEELVLEDEASILQENWCWCEDEEEGPGINGDGAAVAVTQGEGEGGEVYEDSKVPVAASSDGLQPPLQALGSVTTMPLSMSLEGQGGAIALVPPLLSTTAGSLASYAASHQQGAEGLCQSAVSVLQQPMPVSHCAWLSQHGAWEEASSEDEVTLNGEGARSSDADGKVTASAGCALYWTDEGREVGGVASVPRHVGGADCVELAYESCCRSIAELSIHGKVDIPYTRFLAQSLEFVFVAMGSGFASPTYLRVMKESASKAEERMCMALLSMRKKRPSTDMLQTGGHDQWVTQARWRGGTAEYSPRLQEAAEKREHRPVGSPGGPYWSVKVGVEVPTAAWTEELLCTPGAAGVQFVLVRPDTTRSVQLVKTNACMAEHFINETEFGMMGDQQRTMCPTLLARIMTDRSIHAFYSIIGVFSVLPRTGIADSERSCAVELLNRRGQIVPALATVRAHFSVSQQSAILAVRVWPLASLYGQGQVAASSGAQVSSLSQCGKGGGGAGFGAAGPPPRPPGPDVWLDDDEMQLLLGAIA